MTGYDEAAREYWRAGWRAPLPLPPGKKWPPPPGTTGRDAPDPDLGQLAQWAETRRRCGVALRLPADVIGIDVDAWKPAGRRSWEVLQGCCGPVPTWITTSRDDGSGIRLYRVPVGLPWSERRAGPGIELVSRTHRYCMVWPSIHPSGSPYRWLAPDGSTADRVPRVDELSELPQVWQGRLTATPDLPRPTGVVAGTGRASGYPHAMLAGVCEDLAAKLPGQGRDGALFFAALRLGRLVLDGRLSEAEVTNGLLGAAHRNGHIDKHGVRRAERTIASGLQAARTSPARPGVS